MSKENRNWGHRPLWAIVVVVAVMLAVVMTALLLAYFGWLGGLGGGRPLSPQ